MTTLLLAFALTCAAAGPPQPPVLSPPRLRSGTTPAVSATMLSGAETLLEVTVDLDGRVAGVRPLRTAPSITDLVAAAVRGWRFEPAHRRHQIDTVTAPLSMIMPRVSTVLVVAMFRPPSLAAPMRRQTPADIRAGTDETPRPVEWIAPVFPRRAFAPGVVLLELDVDCDGGVSDARVIESAPPFDEPALEAVRQWRFRPAMVDGRPVPVVVYAVLGFPFPTEPEEGGSR